MTALSCWGWSFEKGGMLLRRRRRGVALSTATRSAAAPGTVRVGATWRVSCRAAELPGSGHGHRMKGKASATRPAEGV